MDEQAQRVQAGNSSYLLQTRAVSHPLRYLDQLKTVRQYAGSTIIITGDHGARSSDVLPPEAAMVTGLFEARWQEVLEFNEAPVSSTISGHGHQAAGLDRGACGPMLRAGPDQQLPRYVYHRLSHPEVKPGNLLIYRILGDAGISVIGNWRVKSCLEIGPGKTTEADPAFIHQRIFERSKILGQEGWLCLTPFPVAGCDASARAG